MSEMGGERNGGFEEAWASSGRAEVTENLHLGSRSFTQSCSVRTSKPG